MSHKPLMSEGEKNRRIAWQNRTYEKHLNCKKRYSVDFDGIEIVVLPNVFAPEPWDLNILAKTVLKEVKETDKVLDMGTGTGIQAICAATKSADVTAVDVNPDAVECAKINVKLNNLSSRVKVRQSDLFENVTGKFDLIIFDPPFRWTKPRDMWERSCADENYSALKQFFAEVKNYMNKGGRLVMHFGTSGDITFFRKLIRKNGFKRRQLLKKSGCGWIYFTYRLVSSNNEA